MIDCALSKTYEHFDHIMDHSTEWEWHVPCFFVFCSFFVYLRGKHVFDGFALFDAYKDDLSSLVCFIKKEMLLAM